MPRENPQVKALREENERLRKLYDHATRRILFPDWVQGCGDNSCVVTHPKGMATNGGCRCEPHALRAVLAWTKGRIRHLEDEASTLRRQVKVMRALSSGVGADSEHGDDCQRED